MEKSPALQTSTDVDDIAQSQITIIVRTADGIDEDLRLTTVSSNSVIHLKSQIFQIHPVKPSPTAQRLIYGGRMLKDDDRLGSVFIFDNEEKAPHIVHLVFPRVPNVPPDRTYVRAIRRIGQPAVQGPRKEAHRSQNRTGIAPATVSIAQHDSNSRSAEAGSEPPRNRYFLWYDMASESAGGRERVGGGEREGGAEGFSGDFGLLGNYERQYAQWRQLLTQELSNGQGSLAASNQPLLHTNDSEQIAESDSDNADVSDGYASEEDDDNGAGAEVHNGDWEQPRAPNQALVVAKLAAFVCLFGRDASNGRLALLVAVAIVLFLSQSDWFNMERIWSLLGLHTPRQQTTTPPAAPSDVNATESEVQGESPKLRPSILEEIEQFMVQFFVSLNPESDASLPRGMAE